MEELRKEANCTPAMTRQQRLFSTQGGLKAYMDFAVGDVNLFKFLYYEFCQLFLSGLGGLGGYGLRRIFYPYMFKECGKKVAFGKGLTIRNPSKVTLGRGVLLDDYSSLDARGEGANIVLGPHVSLGRFSSVVAKGGKINLHAGVNIGTHCRVATQSQIEIGESTLIAAYCYIGPGNHQKGDQNAPLIEKEMEIKGGVSIGANSWIGAHTIVLDGAKIGKNAIIGAHSLVKGEIPDNAVAVGIPAKVI